MLSQSEGQVLIDIMNDHGLEQLIHFPTREGNTLDLIITSLPGKFQYIPFPDKLSDHDIVADTLKTFIPPKKKNLSRWSICIKKVTTTQRKDAPKFTKEKYFNGHSNSRSVPENLIW